MLFETICTLALIATLIWCVAHFLASREVEHVTYIQHKQFVPINDITKGTP